MGELSLDGSLRPIRGALAHLVGAERLGYQSAIVPRGNREEAGVAPRIRVRLADDLRQIADHLTHGAPLDFAHQRELLARVASSADLADVRGQQGGRRALELAAAGAHNLLLVGPPGGGKTMLARRLPSILPPLLFEEALRITMIHSVAGLLPSDRGLTSTRPFRSPHHTVSNAGLVGGGDPARPGEVSLAHLGVLFLDEVLEFRRSALEALRQPLEEGAITIARVRSRATYPAEPMLVAAANPCPCGYAGDGSARCGCTIERVRAYRGRLSGPLLDRIDIHVVLPPVQIASLASREPGEPSTAVQARVAAARAVARERFLGGETACLVNSKLSANEVDRVARPDREGMQLITSAVEKLGLSARAYGKVLRVARTIADLEGATAVRSSHVAEAVQARLFDRVPGAALAASALTL